MIRRDKRRRPATGVKPLRRAVVLSSAQTRMSWRAANVTDDERREQQAELRIAAASPGDLCDDLGTGRDGKDD